MATFDAKAFGDSLENKFLTIIQQHTERILGARDEKLADMTLDVIVKKMTDAITQGHKQVDLLTDKFFEANVPGHLQPYVIGNVKKRLTEMFFNITRDGRFRIIVVSYHPGKTFCLEFNTFMADRMLDTF